VGIQRRSAVVNPGRNARDDRSSLRGRGFCGTVASAIHPAPRPTPNICDPAIAFLGTLENPEPRYTLECYPVVILLASALFTRGHDLPNVERRM
jgi:hypothetical protein